MRLVVLNIRVASRHLTGQTEENHENTGVASRSTSDNCAKLYDASPE